MVTADIPQLVEDEIRRRVALTGEAMRTAILSAHVHGTGVVRTSTYGSFIFAKDESDLYHKIIGGMK